MRYNHTITGKSFQENTLQWYLQCDWISEYWNFYNTNLKFNISIECIKKFKIIVLCLLLLDLSLHYENEPAKEATLPNPYYPIGLVKRFLWNINNISIMMFFKRCTTNLPDNVFWPRDVRIVNLKEWSDTHFSIAVLFDTNYFKSPI